MLQSIKGRLRYSGIPQAVLASELGWSTGTISHWLNGLTPLPEGMDERIDQALTRLEKAEVAAHEARARSLAESTGAA